MVLFVMVLFLAPPSGHW